MKVPDNNRKYWDAIDKEQREKRMKKLRRKNKRKEKLVIGFSSIFIIISLAAAIAGIWLFVWLLLSLGHYLNSH